MTKRMSSYIWLIWINWLSVLRDLKPRLIRATMKSSRVSAESLTSPPGPYIPDLRQRTKPLLLNSLGYDNEKQVGLQTGVQARTLTAKTLKYTLPLAKVYTYVGILVFFMRNYLPGNPLNPVLWVVLGVVLILLVIEGLRFLRCGTVIGAMKQVSIVLLEALSAQGAIKTSLKMVGLHVEKEGGEVFVR